ncbi:MAG: class I SAM-dependent rRNA methyltransferase [Deltaproteobacteria bacterium]|nr:class I SAM-dependent rRNA methyltransferase [Deltaproteobacteria bacterium]
MKPLRLKKGEARRLRAGHPWIFSNEIQDPVKAFEPGEIVDVLDGGGRLVGRGYVNPRTLIAVRLLSRRAEPIDEAFFARRLQAAEAWRRRLLPPLQAYRVAYSEADYLPGLIVDRYGPVLVVQVLTAGMERLLPALKEALLKVLDPEVIVLRNDSAYRALEGLPLERQVLVGALSGPVVIEEHGLAYEVDVQEGQKTGFYLDQRENRLALRSVVRGGRVLDAFCYTGAWGLNAAAAGATEVVGVDSSGRALELARRNAARNSLEARCRFVEEDVFRFLRAAEAAREQFDCVILDPPSFIRNRAQVREGLRGYKEINLRALHLLRRGGLLVTCSCSHHLDRQALLAVAAAAAHDARVGLRLLEYRSQARDHPVLPQAPETDYLKCAIFMLD